MNGARDIFSNMTTRGRLGLAASVLGTLVVAFLLVSWAGKPSYTLALTGLDPAETGKITATLDEQGIGYEIRNNGTGIAVDKGQTDEAQIALAEGGLAGAGSRHPGFELVTEQKLGASNFQQQVAYQQALEGQLSTVIEQIDGINRADVQLALPDDQLFQDEAQPATASVLLGADGQTLGTTAVQGIAGLVSSSVKGLKQENITITDAAGQPLWPTSEAGGAAGGASTALQAEAKYGRQLESQVDAMLARTLGPGVAKVQVNADLNMSEGTQEQLQYGDNSVRLKNKRESEAFEGTGGATGGGATGTAGNVPAYANGAAGGGESEYERSSTDQELGVDKTITKTTIAGGEVERLSVALMVDRAAKLSPEQLSELQDTVSAAVGLDAQRGDTIKASQFAFAKTPEAEAPSMMESPMLGYAKYGAIGLGALVFLLMTFRMLRRAERRPLAGEPVWLREIDAPRAISDLERGEDPKEVWRTPDGEMTRTRRRLESVVDEDTDRVAATVRAWMSEG